MMKNNADVSITEKKEDLLARSSVLLMSFVPGGPCMSDDRKSLLMNAHLDEFLAEIMILYPDFDENTLKTLFQKGVNFCLTHEESPYLDKYAGVLYLSRNLGGLLTGRDDGLRPGGAPILRHLCDKKTGNINPSDTLPYVRAVNKSYAYRSTLSLHNSIPKTTEKTSKELGFLGCIEHSLWGYLDLLTDKDYEITSEARLCPVLKERANSLKTRFHELIQKYGRGYSDTVFFLPVIGDKDGHLCQYKKEDVLDIIGDQITYLEKIAEEKAKRVKQQEANECLEKELSDIEATITLQTAEIAMLEGPGEQGVDMKRKVAEQSAGRFENARKFLIDHLTSAKEIMPASFGLTESRLIKDYFERVLRELVTIKETIAGFQESTEMSTQLSWPTIVGKGESKHSGHFFSSFQERKIKLESIIETNTSRKEQLKGYAIEAESVNTQNIKNSFALMESLNDLIGNIKNLQENQSVKLKAVRPSVIQEIDNAVKRIMEIR